MTDDPVRRAIVGWTPERLAEVAAGCRGNHSALYRRIQDSHTPKTARPQGQAVLPRMPGRDHGPPEVVCPNCGIDNPAPTEHAMQVELNAESSLLEPDATATPVQVDLLSPLARSPISRTDAQGFTQPSFSL
ncbi:hypothetical protein GCM10010191_75850 [Actinomadura vinacea]|uniref:Helix-turn-helix domain-containing protein n=1 Tax=Actinomadura vinacea TaxID=115336 RepID=A0ABN3K2B1_9ACTN